MFKISNDEGLVLEVPKNVVINVEKNQPLLNKSDELFQDVSFGFNVPDTDANKLFLKRADLIDTANESYVQSGIHLDISGIKIESGNIRCRKAAAGYDVNLEPNYAAINSLTKDIRVPEILTLDPIYDKKDMNEFEALMLASVQHPEKYPFIYFPVYNDSWAPDELPEPGRHDFSFRPAVNFFDIDAAAFRARPTDTGDIYALSPFFKVTYVLKQIANYLGFSTAGDFFTDDEMNRLVIYTRCGFSERVVAPSMTYMPNISIEDFIKQLRDRLHLALDFNLATGVLTAERFKTIATSLPVDLTKYISKTIEQEVPDKQSLTVTLKSDDQDDAFAITDLQGNVTHPALIKLITGAGDTPLELECGTTKSVSTAGAVSGVKVYPIVSQPLINKAAHLLTGGIPDDLSYTDAGDQTTLNNWPLRLMLYLGYNDVDGKKWPSADAYNLNADDANFYRFLNNSKRLIITAYMPPVVLASINLTGHYGHKTQDGNYVSYLLEKLIYDAGTSDGLIPVKIYARKFSYKAVDDVSMIPFASISQTPDNLYMSGHIKAYFDPAIHGVSQVTVAVLNEDGSLITPDPIVSPANYRGTGGVGVPIIKIWGAYSPAQELRVYQGAPKYVVFLGLKVPFVNNGAYWSADVTNNYLLESFTGPLLENYTIFF